MKKITATFVLICTALGAAYATGEKEAGGGASGTSSAAAAYTIEIGGSTSVSPLMELLAAAYSKLHSNVRININGTGSSDGIKAAAAGTSEVGMSSRELSATEKGQGLTELVIAIDGIAVIVNRNNPVSNLTIEQIRGIYTGVTSDWSAVTDSAKKGKIAVVSREPGSGTRGAFEEIIKFQDKLLAGATEFDGTGAVKAEISRNADAIGYISLGSVDSSVNTVNVNGVAATTANVVNGSYKIARPFIVLYRKAAINPETQAFLTWIMSEEAQKIVGTSWISVK
ncbi:MAG: phosphate ABC transporter substrate-binding protein [Spirochaetaceae bacterium]|jgi:phosphate transport system substrate-binding protein|nr:phosphate ABC transporter substrate-binding protein [Spirochaetaceae bacterium]